MTQQQAAYCHLKSNEGQKCSILCIIPPLSSSRNDEWESSTYDNLFPFELTMGRLKSDCLTLW